MYFNNKYNDYSKTSFQKCIDKYQINFIMFKLNKNMYVGDTYIANLKPIYEAYIHIPVF